MVQLWTQGLSLVPFGLLLQLADNPRRPKDIVPFGLLLQLADNPRCPKDIVPFGLLSQLADNPRRPKDIVPFGPVPTPVPECLSISICWGSPRMSPTNSDV